MMNLTPPAEYLSIVLHFIACSMLLCGLLVWMQRQENLIQRIFLATSLLIIGAGTMVRVLMTYQIGIPSSYPVLPIDELYAGFWEILLLFLYPLETVNPGWLRKRGLVLLFLPIIVISIVLMFVPMEFRDMYSWGNIITYINEPNVWFRLLILFVFIVPLTILLLCVPYNWRRSNVDAKWIRIYAVGMQGIGLFYTLFVLTGSVTFRAVHLTYCTLFFIYITYQELYLRLFPAKVRTAEGEQQRVDHPKTTAPGCDELSVEDHGLWRRLEEYIKQKEPWRSPDITISEVAKAIGSSRSVLSAEISSHGIDSFHTLVANCRIEEFCKMVKDGAVENVNEALFSVGFRSRSTAYKRFKEQMGMTPAEYIKTIKNGSL